MWSADCLDIGEEVYPSLVEECEMSREALLTLYGEACLDHHSDLLSCFYTAECEDDQPCEAIQSDFLDSCVQRPGEACLAKAAKSAQCGEPSPDEAQSCQLTIDLSRHKLGQECALAYEQYFMCEASLECDASGCDAEVEAITAQCT